MPSKKQGEKYYSIYTGAVDIEEELLDELCQDFAPKNWSDSEEELFYVFTDVCRFYQDRKYYEVVLGRFLISKNIDPNDMVRGFDQMISDFDDKDAWEPIFEDNKKSPWR